MELRKFLYHGRLIYLCKKYVGDLDHKIVKLRNHYVHHGYYIPDKSIEYGEKNDQKYDPPSYS